MRRSNSRQTKQGYVFVKSYPINSMKEVRNVISKNKYKFSNFKIGKVQNFIGEPKGFVVAAKFKPEYRNKLSSKLFYARVEGKIRKKRSRRRKSVKY